MIISQRLTAIAESIKFTTIADIGTDHGYIPIYMCKNRRLKKAIACDIKKGPLGKAELNIKTYGYEDTIETRLGDGLSPIKPYEVETIVIAGMGGMLALDILKEGRQVVRTAKQLVLQPQLDICEVRRYVHSIGFCIDDEKMICEDGKYYTILDCSQGIDNDYSLRDYTLGKRLLESKNPVLKEYLIKERDKLRQIAEELERTGNAAERLAEIKNKLEIYTIVN